MKWRSYGACAKRSPGCRFVAVDLVRFDSNAWNHASSLRCFKWTNLSVEMQDFNASDLAWIKFDSNWTLNPKAERPWLLRVVEVKASGLFSPGWVKAWRYEDTLIPETKIAPENAWLEDWLPFWDGLVGWFQWVQMFLRKLHPLLRSLEEKKDDFEKLWKVVCKNVVAFEAIFGWPSGLAAWVLQIQIKRFPA